MGLKSRATLAIKMMDRSGQNVLGLRQGFGSEESPYCPSRSARRRTLLEVTAPAMVFPNQGVA
jgi:hypothetical protein